MIRVGLVGASGRTGRYVVEALRGSKEAVLHSAIVSPGSPKLGSLVADTELYYSSEFSSLAGADVVIDFSNPATSVAVVEWCAAQGVPVLVATTGHSAEQVGLIKGLGSKVAVGLTPNTSVGAAALTSLVEKAKGLLGDGFDIEVLEIHHRMKKDAPSGTALSVVEPIADRERLVFGRPGTRREGEVGMVSLRGGDVVGDHTVYFLGHGERIEHSHRVSSREVFGSGAVRLAERLVMLPAGVYSARQLLLG
ncbi:MAG: 4-hydroxy-tetrahydrodipicolinate reductase [Pseudomonadota bacterium]